MASGDWVRLIVSSQQLDKPISLPFIRRHRQSPKRFLVAIERIIQFNKHFSLDESITVNVETPRGGTGRKRDVVIVQGLLNKKQCLLQKKDDQLCCARAIVVAKASMTTIPSTKVF